MRPLKITPRITSRNSFIDKYLSEISKFKLLTEDEEVQLAEKIRNGDDEAKELLIKSNLRFVVSVAKQHQCRGLGLVDLINEGNLGLIKAAEKFDATKGFKFISYAVWWIRQHIMCAIAENEYAIRVPANKIYEIAKYNKTLRKLEQNLGRTPTNDEIADFEKVDSKKIEKISTIERKCVSLDAPATNHCDSKKVKEILPCSNTEATDKGLVQDSLSVEIKRAFTLLTEREAKVLTMLFGIDMEPCHISIVSKSLNLTGERVRQIKLEALKKLRFSTKSSLLKAFLG